MSDEGTRPFCLFWSNGQWTLGIDSHRWELRGKLRKIKEKSSFFFYPFCLERLDKLCYEWNCWNCKLFHTFNVNGFLKSLSLLPPLTVDLHFYCSSDVLVAVLPAATSLQPLHLPVRPNVRMWDHFLLLEINNKCPHNAAWTLSPLSPLNKPSRVPALFDRGGIWSQYGRYPLPARSVAGRKERSPSTWGSVRSEIRSVLRDTDN